MSHTINKKLNSETVNWHSLSLQAVIEKLKTSLAGLSYDESLKRLEEYGYNQLPSYTQRSALMRFLSQFHNLLIYVLIAATVATFFIGKYVDMSVILLVVLINATVSFLQEGKAEQAIQAVSRILSLTAQVRRNHKRFEMPATELVPGDIVFVQSGDKVPADLRLFNTKGLQINEAVLTGESYPVKKQEIDLPEATLINDRINMAFSGTLVTSGQAYGVVVATGQQTEIGKIGQLLSTVVSISTPLLRKITVFSRWLAGFILTMAGFIFAYGLLVHSYGFEEMFMAAIGIAVAAIPEGLPIVLTITLAISVQRMAKRHVIIRRLPVIEALGCVKIICSDKTGTLTKNEMTVNTVILGKGKFQVSGVGYDAHGEFYHDDSRIYPHQESDLAWLVKIGVLCNEANFEINEAEKKLLGDPTEGALLTLAIKAGLDPYSLRKQSPILDTIPFDSEHRFMATLHHDAAENEIIYIKGAPEIIFQGCRWQQVSEKKEIFDLEYWQAQVNALAEMGQRTLALAYKLKSSDQMPLSLNTVNADLILVGVVGIMDVPRDEAIRSVRECHQAGISVKMITGDHAITANVIARQIGIHTPFVLTGAEFDRMNDQEFLENVEKVNVFARMNPAHKLRLVNALQTKGYVVAMTGDGVNDAPALKRADIGIAMGMKGTEAAKDASDMVITDDNFASIVEAVRQGRTAYDNLKKLIAFLLPINGGESLSLTLAILFGHLLPITPLQILWVNMVSSVTLGIALAFEPTEKQVMQRLPVPLKESLLSKFLVWRIVFVSTIFVAGIFGIFKISLYLGYSLETARTLAVNTLIIMEMFYLFSSRYLHGPSLTWQGMQGTRVVLIAISFVAILQLIFIYVPFMHEFFHTRALSLFQMMTVGAVGIAVFVLCEIEKLTLLFLKRRRNKTVTV